MKAAYRINWTEYERGWGSRPDGYTLCRDREAAETRIKEHWAKYPPRSQGVPDYYIAPSDPFLVEIDDELAEQLEVNGWLTFD